MISIDSYIAYFLSLMTIGDKFLHMSIIINSSITHFCFIFVANGGKHWCSPFSRIILSHISLFLYWSGTYLITRDSLLHMKITESVAKSLHQDSGLCYLYLPIFSYTYDLLFCCKIKSCCDHCFRQLYLLQDYSSVRIVVNMSIKLHKQPVVYTMLV